MAKWGNPLKSVKPFTAGLFMLTTLWASFQWLDPTPPPVLDQLLVAAFGIWFANEAIEKKNKRPDDDEDDDKKPKAEGS